jgi:hypothetical protein
MNFILLFLLSVLNLIESLGSPLLPDPLSELC